VRSLRSRLTLSFALLVCGVGLALGIYISTIFAGQLATEVHKRGETLARHLAEIAADAVISEDRLTLHTLIHSVLKSEEDIDYIFFVDHDGDQILADSFDGNFPSLLLSANPLPTGKAMQRREVDVRGEAVYDIVAEVLTARAGFVHLGLSAGPVRKTITSLVTHTLIAVLLFTIGAILAASPIARSISEPITRLTKAVHRVAGGHPAEHIEHTGFTEIGELATAYNSMVENLSVAEKQLKAQLAFREALLSDLPEAVFYKDRQGAILGCSKVFADFFGLDTTQIIGRTEQELFPEDSLHRTKEAELLANGGVISYECLVQRNDLSSRSIIFFKTTFSDANGDPAGIIGVMQDVTREREADRLKSEFVSAVAHEFQTPLATVLGFAELILDRGLSAEDRAEGLRMIMEKAERLSHLVDELLDLSRLETGRKFSLHPETCSLRQIITGVTDDFQRSAPHHHFELYLPAGDLPLVADISRINQVLENLLSNAVKYSAKGSCIRISIAEHAADYELTINDEGRGMTAEQVEHAFDKFYRADTSDSAPSGTGLGLYLAQTLIAMHGGQISIKSPGPGRGSTVNVELPHHPLD